MFVGALEKLQHVIRQPLGAGKAGVQLRDDAVQRGVAIDQLQDGGGAVVQLGHAFRVEDHVAVLHLLPLQAVAAAEDRGAFRVQRHYTSLWLCHTRAAVTL